MRTVSATTDVDVPPLDVWAVLADLASYSEWNPLFREAAGELTAGSVITLKTAQPGGTERGH